MPNLHNARRLSVCVTLDCSPSDYPPAFSFSCRHLELPHSQSHLERGIITLALYALAAQRLLEAKSAGLAMLLLVPSVGHLSDQPEGPSPSLSAVWWADVYRRDCAVLPPAALIAVQRVSDA